MLRVSLIKILPAFSLFLSLAQQSRGEAERTFAIVPHHTPVTLANQWQPLIQELNHQTGVRFRFVTAPTVTEFERRLLNGECDYTYMNAAVILEAKKLQDYRGLAQRQKPLKGILVVRADGPTGISGLCGPPIKCQNKRSVHLIR
ncbi:MAG: PhnD/SsuA/transferrin family substrate-binding protein [Acidiferrobacterales bacterium]